MAVAVGSRVGLHQRRNQHLPRQTLGGLGGGRVATGPTTWTQGLYNEVDGTAIDWVRADDLSNLIYGWLPAGRGTIKCVDALIRILRRMAMPDQVARGLAWMSGLCVQDNRATVKQTWTSDEWLKEVRSAAEEHGLLNQWQMLVDAMVVAGNEGLAPYSR